MTIDRKSCKVCNKEFSGRSDKIFCSLECKNYYHVNLRRVTRDATVAIDRILHRNRSILLEIMGKNSAQKKVPRLLLDRKKFNYKYITNYTINSKGKQYNYVYDFAWMSFSNNEVLIVRKR